MIDKKLFASAMGTLASSYGRTVDEATIKVYYCLLSAQLKTDEFERAVAGVLANETWWPSPAVLLRHARPAPDGAAQFAALVSELNGCGGFRFFSLERFRALSEPVRRGIAAVGGLRAISLCEERDWPWLERRFVTAYNEAAVAHLPALGRAATERPAISRGEVSAAVKQLVSGTAATIGAGMDPRAPKRRQVDSSGAAA